MTTTSIFDQIRIAKGSHDDDCANPERCLMEWYNWLTRKFHTDDCPPDVSPALHIFGMRLNDALGDDRRQELKQFLPQNGTPSPLAGTRDDGHEEIRGYLALDWLIRTYTPAWLDLAGLTVEATALRDLRRIVDLVAAQAAGPVVRDARAKAAAAPSVSARVCPAYATWVVRLRSPARTRGRRAEAARAPVRSETIRWNLAHEYMVRPSAMTFH